MSSFYDKPLKSMAEIDAWMEEFGKQNEAALRAHGVKKVDFRVSCSSFATNFADLDLSLCRRRHPTLVYRLFSAAPHTSEVVLPHSRITTVSISSTSFPPIIFGLTKTLI
jgi:hypothetical protein